MLDPVLQKLRRRLMRWELPHLRTLAAQQAERIEELERALYNAEASLDFWHSHALDLQNTLHETGAGQVGLTQAGELLILPPATAPSQQAIGKGGLRMTPTSIFGFPIIIHRPLQRYKLPADVPPPSGMTREEFDDWSKRVCGFAPPTMALIAPNSALRIGNTLHITEEHIKRLDAVIGKCMWGPL